MLISWLDRWPDNYDQILRLTAKAAGRAATIGRLAAEVAFYKDQREALWEYIQRHGKETDQSETDV